MGIEKNIGAEQFPKQRPEVGQRAKVCFHYDTARLFPATIIRDDAEEPFRTILKLDDGRVVLATECQWTSGEV